MPTRSARTTWTGGLQDGTGTVELVSSGVGRYVVSFPRRAAEEAGGVTSPEELIAAAHTACFAMQFAALLGAAGGSGQSLDVTAEKFAEVAEQAKKSCPVSKALAGTDISLEVLNG